MTNTNDYSGYLEDMHAAKKKAAVAELTSAYNKNVAALDTAEKKISPVYQAARNQAAGESERSGRNFAEYAAGTGLTTGAGGQAKLARTIALQNGLNDLNAREADDRADLALQRSQLESEYNAAVAKARADGNYELADALYQEAVRRDDTGYQRAYQQQMLDYQKQRDTVADSQWQSQIDYQKSRDTVTDARWQSQFDYQKSRDAVADSQWQAKYDSSQADALAEYGNLFLNQGLMPSQEMLSAMGITAADAQSYIDRLKLAASLAAAGGGGNDKEVEPEWGSGYSTALNQNGVKASEWAMVRNNIASNLRAGNFQNVSTYLDQVSGGMSKEQWNEIAALLSQYGYSGVQTY